MYAVSYKEILFFQSIKLELFIFSSFFRGLVDLLLKDIIARTKFTVKKVHISVHN